MLRDSRGLRCLAAAASGAVVPLAFAPLQWFWIALLSLGLFYYLVEGQRPRDGWWIGACYGWSSFLFGTSWVYVSVREFGQAPLPVALLVTVGMVFILGLYAAIVGYVGNRYFTRFGQYRLLLVWPALWVLGEWLRGQLLSGFGWLGLGYSQSDSVLMGYAPVVGVLGISLVVAFSSGALLFLLLRPGVRQGAAVALAGLLWLTGLALQGIIWTQPRAESVSVSLVQGAIPQDQKWLPRSRAPTLALYAELTQPELGRDLIIWPEAAIPDLYHRVEPYLARMEAAALARNSLVLLGILRDDPDSTFQNTVVALDGERSSYVKRHLVPFGEYFPVPKFVRRWMRLMSLPYTDAEPGKADQAPLAVGNELLGVTICYEDVFGAEQLAFARNASILVNVSNDAWFGDSIAAHQHLQIARLRAAEAGRYLLRATNTGISAVINPQGEIMERSPQFRAAVLRAEVTGMDGHTPYARFGDWPAMMFCALMLLVAVVRQRFSPPQS